MSETLIENDNYCCVCYNRHNTILDCNHSLCVNCLLSMFKHNDKCCPICKRQYTFLSNQVDDDEEDYEEDYINDYLIEPIERIVRILTDFIEGILDKMKSFFSKKEINHLVLILILIYPTYIYRK